MKILSLSNRVLIQISGTERLEFLQGLITVDIYQLTSNHGLWGGILSPQGKALYDFFIYEIRGIQAVFIDVHYSQCDKLVQHLQKYMLRSDVHIAKNTDFHITAIWDNTDMVTDNNATIITDPRLNMMGLRHIATLENHQAFMQKHHSDIVHDDDYKALRIQHNIIDPTEDMLDIDYYWPEINAEAINGIDYKKGCYVGQEVTARLKHKAELKRKIVPVFVMGNPQTPAAMATDIQDIGTLLCFDELTGKGLAYVRLDRWEYAIETLRSVTAGMSMITKA